MFTCCRLCIMVGFAYWMCWYDFSYQCNFNTWPLFLAQVGFEPRIVIVFRGPMMLNFDPAKIDKTSVKGTLGIFPNVDTPTLKPIRVNRNIEWILGFFFGITCSCLSISRVRVFIDSRRRFFLLALQPFCRTYCLIMDSFWSSWVSWLTVILFHVLRFDRF